MRPLTPNSAAYASHFLQRGYDAQSTADALNLARPLRPPYQADDIRHFRDVPALQDWPPQNNAPYGPAPLSSPVSHGAASMSLSQRIVQLEDQRSSLANMDGSVDSRIAELTARDSQAQLMRTLIEQRNPQDLSGAPLPSGHSVDSRAMGSTQDSRYSDASGQHPPSSLASASRATVNPRREDRRMAAAPYPPSKSSGSGATTIDNGSCRHKLRVKINPDTFIACSDTDDELAVLDQKALNRVASRKSRSKKAARLGLTSIAELHRLAADTRAANAGYPSRHAADLAGKDKRAAKNGHPSRHAAREARENERAAERGHPNRHAAREAQKDRLAVLQLGQGASRVDLDRTQRKERELAEQIGIDVREIRSVRGTVTPL